MRSDEPRFGTVLHGVTTFDAFGGGANGQGLDETKREQSWVLANHALSVVEHDRVVRSEFFDEGQLDDALRRARELDRRTQATAPDDAEAQEDLDHLAHESLPADKRS